VGQSCNCYQLRPQAADSEKASRYRGQLRNKQGFSGRISSRGPTATALPGKGCGSLVELAAAMKNPHLLKTRAMTWKM